MNKAAAVLGVLAAVVALCNAYDFSDTYFNQYLANELQDLYHSSDDLRLHARSRRDDEAVSEEKCRRHRGPPMCCGGELHRYMMDRDLQKQCFLEVLGTKDTPRGPPPDPFKCDKDHREDMMCVLHCVGQKQNLIDEDGQIKETEMREFMKDAFSNSQWLKPKEDEIINKCIAENKNKMEQWKKEYTQNTDCTPTTILFFHCVFREIQMACPDEEIKDMKMCKRIREDINKYGDFLPPQKPPMDEE